MDKTRKRSLARTPTSLTFVSEADLKEYEKSRNSLKGRFQDFCSETSFSPVSHIYKAGSTGKKFIWIFTCLGLTAYMSYQCSNLIINYMKHPSEVDIVLAFASELNFPSVTVCNLNPLRRGKLINSQYGEFFQNLKDDGSDDILYRSAHGRMFHSDESHESSEEGQ